MTEEGGSAGTSRGVTAPTGTKSRPLITPEPFSGTGSFSDWVDHFEGVAAVNEWDDAAKLLWMRVRLVGRAQTAYGRLPDTSKTDYATLKKALKEGSNLIARRNSISASLALGRESPERAGLSMQMNSVC